MYSLNIGIRNVIFIAFVLLPVFCKGQNVDSLENVLSSQHITTEEKIQLCDDLSWAYMNFDFEKSKKYAQQGIALSGKNKNDLMTGTLYRNLGVAYYMVSKNDTAKMYLEKALFIGNKIKNENLKMLATFALANLYNVQGDTQKALSYYLQALPIAERLKNKQRIRVILGNVATVYAALKNYDQAEKYFTKSKNISIEIKDISGLGQAYDGLSGVFIQKNLADSALHFSLRAIECFRETGEKHFEAISTQGLAMVYYKQFNDLTNAEKYAKKGLKLAQEAGLPGYVAGALNVLSNVYLNARRFKECEQAALQAIDADTTDANIHANMIANVAVANIYLGNKEKARTYFDHYTKHINQRANQNFQESISEMEVKYQTEKKDIEISTLLKQKRLYGIVAVSIVFALLAFLLSFYLRHKNIKAQKQLAEQKIIQLEQEKLLVATQAVLEGEAAERTRIARDLHDGLGGMLSAVKLNLFDVKNGRVLGQDDIARFNKVMSMLDNSMQELRRVAHNMMPETLLNYGLKASLSDFCSNFHNVNFQYFGNEDRLDPKLETTIYRIVYELINNAEKHAQAQHINVQIVQDNKRISLIVQDDGYGFDPTIKTVGSGLNNIKNRIQSMNGKIEIYSKKDEGTEVSVEFKLLSDDTSSNSR